MIRTRTIVSTHESSKQLIDLHRSSPGPCFCGSWLCCCGGLAGRSAGSWGCPVALLALAALLAQGGGASSFTVLETGRGYGSLQEAVDAIGDREGTVIIAPGNWSECAVQSEGVVHFRAAEAGKALLDLSSIVQLCGRGEN